MQQSIDKPKPRKSPGQFRFVIAVVLAILSIANSHAEVVISVQSSGNDVIMTSSGTINTAALTPTGGTVGSASDTYQGILEGTQFFGTDILIVGLFSLMDAWGGISGPFPFSIGPIFTSSTSSGDAVGLSQPSTVSALLLPHDYTSGSALQGTSVYTNVTLSSMGFLTGSYQYTWGSGANADSLTINIVEQLPRLLITPAGSSAILTWQTNFTGFYLQSTTNPVSGVWTTNLPTPVVIGDQNTVTNPTSGAQQFYRLSR